MKLANYYDYLNLINNICKEMLCNDIYARVYMNNPFPEKIIDLISYYKFINDIVHKENIEYKEYEFKLNLIFNIRIYYKNIDEQNFENDICKVINFFNDIIATHINQKCETIDKFQLYLENYNKKTFPTTLPYQYLESEKNNKYSNCISRSYNDFCVVSNKKINAMVVDKIKKDFEDDKKYFYNTKNSKNKIKYFTYIIIFIFYFLIQCAVISLSFLYVNNYFVLKNIVLSICSILLFFELIFTINVALKMKNSNYRNHYPFFMI